MKRIVFYLFYDEHGIVDDYVVEKLKALRSRVETIFVVSNSALEKESGERLAAVADVVHMRENIGFDVWGYKEAMEVFGRDKLDEYDELILMNYTFFGPIFPFEETFDKMAGKDCDFWGITAHKEMVPNPFTGQGKLPWHLNSHWIAVRKSLFRTVQFRSYWDGMPKIESYVDSILLHESRFTAHFEALGFRCEVTYPLERYPTEYPAFQSVELMLGDRCPILKRRLFFHDPLFLEQNSLLLKETMLMVEKAGYTLDLIWKNVLRTAKPRTLHTNLDLLDILPDHDEGVDADFNGRIAVVAHLYYDDMVEETMDYVRRIPYDYDLFVSTSDDAKKERIEKQLASIGEPRYEVRVVEQNRGRDMSSLFITFRDVLLSRNYDYICRVHSKKSPQNGYNMALQFKKHMFDNLLHSRGYIGNLLRLFEADRTLGMVFPPVVQIAYPTLGHAWFSNKKPAKEWASRLGLRVSFDDATPVAPYGTMFWFRPDAVRKIAEYPLQWTDFDPEPNHVDGSLAHVLERLLGYVTIDAGYRLGAVMNHEIAAFNYTKMEYKLQRLASEFPNGNILDQVHWMESAKRIISCLHDRSGMDPWVHGGRWIEESRQLQEKLREFHPDDSHADALGKMNQALILQREVYSSLPGSELADQLGWLNMLKSRARGSDGLMGRLLRRLRRSVH